MSILIDCHPGKSGISLSTMICDHFEITSSFFSYSEIKSTPLLDR